MGQPLGARVLNFAPVALYIVLGQAKSNTETLVDRIYSVVYSFAMDYRDIHVTFRSTPEERERLKREAQRLNITLTELIKRSVESYLSTQSKGGAVSKSA